MQVWVGSQVTPTTSAVAGMLDCITLCKTFHSLPAPRPVAYRTVPIHACINTTHFGEGLYSLSMQSQLSSARLHSWRFSQRAAGWATVGTVPNQARKEGHSSCVACRMSVQQQRQASWTSIPGMLLPPGYSSNEQIGETNVKSTGAEGLIRVGLGVDCFRNLAYSDRQCLCTEGRGARRSGMPLHGPACCLG